tara:strand:+ start:136 stop:399 length:264 start_codon:yes stop_codon:yes gene_type:complete
MNKYFGWFWGMDTAVFFLSIGIINLIAGIFCHSNMNIVLASVNIGVSVIVNTLRVSKEECMQEYMEANSLLLSEVARLSAERGQNRW